MSSRIIQQKGPKINPLPKKTQIPEGMEKIRERPNIDTNDRQLRDVSNEALEALVEANNPPNLFVRSGKIVRFLVDEQRKPNIEIVDEKILMHYMTLSADFSKGKNAVTPQLGVVKDILARGNWKFPPLKGIVGCPVLREDGSILSNEGYDPKTCLIYYKEPDLVVPSFPYIPTLEDIKRAIEIIDDVLIDVPFADKPSNANYLGLLITPLIRPAISGQVPLAIINSPQAGTGKSMLSSIVSIVATGQEPTLFPYTKNPEELRKKVTSVLLSGANVICLDNVAIELNSEILAAALTAPVWGDRLLGKNEQLRLLQRAIWMANGNNVRLGGDIPRRCFLINVDAKMSKPWKRDQFNHPNLIQYVGEIRGDLIWAILVIARSWFVNDRPPFSGQIIGGFSEWSNMVGGMLENVGIPNFLGNLDDMYDTADEEGQQWEAFLTCLHHILGEKWFTTAEICSSLKSNQSIVDTLPDEFTSPFTYDEKIDQGFKRSLGRELGKREGTRFGNSQIYLEKAKDKSRKVAIWRILRG